MITLDTNSDFALGPQFERVIILPDPPKSYSFAGVEIHSESAETVNTGTVIAMGPLAHNGTTFRVGDKVIYQKFAGQTISWQGTEYKIILANDVLVAINNSVETKENGSTLRAA